MRDGDISRDEQLLAELRAAAGRIDPPPPEVIEAAHAVFTWRTIDAELAELTYDSLMDDRPLVGIRGGGGPQVLSFEAPEVTIDLEIARQPGDRRRLVGQLAPPQPASIEIRTLHGTTAAQADERGRLLVDGVDPGPLSLRCRLDSGTVVVTEWTSA
jgi:hypothetical protein